jgi:hypothetical protein
VHIAVQSAMLSVAAQAPGSLSGDGVVMHRTDGGVPERVKGQGPPIFARYPTRSPERSRMGILGQEPWNFTK